MSKIHPSAIIDPKAELGDVEIGPFCVVGPHVKMGDGCKLMSHVVVDGFTTMGKNNTFYPFASAGLLAQHARSNAPDAQLIIGDNNTFREQVTLHVGSEVDKKITIIGNNNLMLVGVHVAHDCVVGNGCVMSNHATLAGHVIVEDNVTMGGFSAVLQFTHIGKGCMIGGTCGILRDVIPYGIVMNNTGKSELAGLNLIGLQRRGVEKKTIFEIQKAYKMLFNKEDGTFAERIQKLATSEQFKDIEQVQDIIRFVQNPSKNMILQPEK